jgi:hypothetical protein
MSFKRRWTLCAATSSTKKQIDAALPSSMSMVAPLRIVIILNPFRMWLDQPLFMRGAKARSPTATPMTTAAGSFSERIKPPWAKFRSFL